jgi:ATP-dependent Clp protease ATP-binding subunit ClpA
MFDRFTDRARNVMSYSRSEAERLGHDYIGPEHILLGLLKEGNGVAVSVLQSSGLTLDAIQAEMEKYVQKEKSATFPFSLFANKKTFPFTPRAKRVLELAVDEARIMNNDHVGTEHLLVALLREEENLAAQILMNLGLKLGDVRNELKEYLELAALEPYLKRLETATINVFTVARQETERLKHDFIGTEHLLIAMSIASTVFEKLGLDAKEIRQGIAKFFLEPPPHPLTTVVLPFTPCVKRTLSTALKEADEARAEKVSCAHLLLALLQETDSSAEKVLAEAGMTLEKARKLL